MLPTFKTDRLILRERAMTDLHSCLLMDQDPKVVRYINGPWDDVDKHETFIKERILHQYPNGLGYWTILSKINSKFLGWILLIPMKSKGGEIEIGWRLIQNAWGKGYATEAVRAILQHAIYTLAISKVYADIHPDNTGSMRVAEKLSFFNEGLMKNEDGPFIRFTYERQK